MSNYSQISVSKPDKQMYIQLADEISKAKSVPVSVPAAIRLAVLYYRERELAIPQ